MVEQFVLYFYKHIRDASARDVETMYTLTFNKIGADFFPNTPWPHMNELKHLVDDDVFWILYQELYYRHLYKIDSSRVVNKQEMVTVQDRRNSWENYMALFSIILSRNVNMKLPNVWLWDMIDEFLYQFQNFSQWKTRLSVRSPDDVEFIRTNPTVWSPEQVGQLLNQLADKAGIRKELAADNGQAIFESDGLVGTSNVLRMLGYFSLIGLCRFHCIIGQHEEALKALAPLNPFVRHYLYAPKIPMANINLYYYAGSSYLMLKRYIDAGRCFNTILSFIYRVKDQQRTSASYELILKKNEQLYNLLAVTVSLCPAVARWCEENVLDQLKSKLEDDIRRMHNGEMEAYEKLFAYGCPKFVTVAPVDLDSMSDTRMAAYKAQLKSFLAEADAAHQLPALKSFLKLYTSISTEKLSQLLNTDVDTLLSVLRNMQKRIQQTRWVGGDAASGQTMAITDIDFKIEKCKETGSDLVVVQEQRVQKNHLATLSKHIMRFGEIVRDMEIHMTTPVPTAVAR